MVQSAATTVEAYLAEMPDDRRDAIGAVRDAICKKLPGGLPLALVGEAVARTPVDAFNRLTGRARRKARAG